MPQATLVTTSSESQSPTNLSDGYQVGASAAALVGFFGATPVSQPSSPAGNAHTVSAGSTTAAYTNTSYDGGIGSTAYTLGDVVAALKNLGLLAK